MSECEFRFDSLKNYLNLMDCNHVFLSEDSTGIISSVSYYVRADSFTRYSPSLVNGLPSVNQFKTNGFCQLEQ
ncbi:unnamed protein product [Adineta steineri]|uniref:Uncharacterized protein n=1 Tax=Adineta steineri TaxID=433720 RepID=A0A815RAR9_9BILA|nr:unnamed protein product [Adineta steineri]CAF3609329.1 unnamed protein product [Adineta steineri]CAF4091196.1 unnamed protein product [Adineta steineri]